MKAEYLQTWMMEATREDTPGTTKWDNVVEIIQSAFGEGRLPMECYWQMVVLILKGMDHA